MPNDVQCDVSIVDATHNERRDGMPPACIGLRCANHARPSKSSCPAAWPLWIHTVESAIWSQQSLPEPMQQLQPVLKQAVKRLLSIREFMNAKSCPPDIVNWYMASTDSPQVRQWAILSPAADFATVRSALSDDNALVRAAGVLPAMKTIDTHPEVLELLYRLVDDPHAMIRQMAVRGLMQYLQRKRDLEAISALARVCVSDSAPQMQRELARVPEVPWEVLQPLVNHTAWEVRDAIARRVDLDESSAMQLAADKDWRVVVSLALNDKCPVSALTQLANSTSVEDDEHPSARTCAMNTLARVGATRKVVA